MEGKNREANRNAGSVAADTVGECCPPAGDEPGCSAPPKRSRVKTLVFVVVMSAAVAVGAHSLVKGRGGSAPGGSGATPDRCDDAGECGEAARP